MLKSDFQAFSLPQGAGQSTTRNCRTEQPMSRPHIYGPLRLRLHQEPTAADLETPWYYSGVPSDVTPPDAERDAERDNQRTTDMADVMVLVDLCGSGRLQDLLLIVERYGSPQVMKWLDRMGAMQSGTGL